MLRSRRRLAFWAITVLLPSLFLVLAGEVALRLAMPPMPASVDPAGAGLLTQSERTEVQETSNGRLMGLVRPSDVPGLVYELKADRSWRIEGKLARTNHEGVRGGPQASEGRAASVLRVAGVGDSVTFGWGVADEETYLERLKSGLESTLGTGRVEVLNYGVPGYNSVQEAALVRARVLPGHPDLLILGYVLNDAEPTLFDEQAARRSLLDSSQLFQLARDLLADFDTPSGRSRRAASQALGQIGRMAGERGVPALFFVYPNVVRGENPEHARRIARDSGFTVVDLYAAFEAEYRRTGTSLRDVTLSPTDAHPNPAGHDLIARTLLPHVLASLGRAARRRT